MLSKHIDILNIGLILISLVLAIMLPFELFLFSYAFLGPLHYLTELNWLQEKQFFLKKRYDFVPLVLLCLATSLHYLSYDLLSLDFAKEFRQGLDATFMADVFRFLEAYSGFIVFLSFLIAVAFVLFEDWKRRLISIGLGLIGGILAYDEQAMFLIFAFFLPTVIHITIFTGIFMLYGAIRSRSKMGYASTILFIVCSLSFFYLQLPETKINPYTLDTLLHSSLHEMTATIANFSLQLPLGAEFNISSPLGIRIQTYLAFAYTYHFLNWFSKTKIIEWHKTSKRSLFWIGFLWLLSVGLYQWDYRLGLTCLTFLSVLHVFMEFPLNVVSIKGVFEEVKAKLLLKKN